MAEGHKVTGASLDKILTRLSSSGQNRPMNAGTFADWSTEAGDRVTMTRDGQSYTSQVHSTTMTWKGGAPTVEMNSTGNEKRDPITKISKKKYGRSGAGGRISQQTYDWQVNQEHLLYEVRDNLTGRLASLEVDINGIRGRVEDGEGRIGKLELRANRFSARIEKVVDESGNVKYAEIAAGINDSDETYAYITAEHVRIGGQLKLSNCIEIREGGIAIRATPVMFGTNLGNMVNINNGRINSRAYNVYATNGSDYYPLDYSAIGSMIKTVTVSNNTLHITRWDGTTENFSKATWLEGEWTSSGVFTVRAYQQNGSTKTAVGDPLTRHLTTGTTSLSGNTYTVPIRTWYGQTPPTYEETGYSVTVNATERYNAGWDYGITQHVRSTRDATSGETTIKTLTSGQRWTIIDTYTKSNGTTTETKYTVAAPTVPSYSSRQMICDDIQDTAPGSSIKKYYFMLEGSYGFSLNTRYAFYRTSW